MGFKYLDQSIEALFWMGEDILYHEEIDPDEQEILEILSVSPDGSHSDIYRGKDLGTTLTAAQKAAIADGSFDDLFVGDYWTINNRVYRIADIDYYYNSGDTAFTKHHLVIVPDASFGGGYMNSSSTTAGAYAGSYMRSTSGSVLNSAKTTISNDFGTAIATHRVYLQNAKSTDGYASAGAWYDSTVELMNEPMVYGSYIYAPGSTGSITPNRYTVEDSQLALFRLNHHMINPYRYTYWLRDAVSSTRFTILNINGGATSTEANNSNHVRPSFCIVGD